MLPPSVPLPPVAVPSPGAFRAVQGAQPNAGETAAALARPETTVRVDPPRVLPAVVALLDEARRREPPPDPEAPAGPPPAFDATPLERERERLRETADLLPDARPAARAEEADPIPPDPDATGKAEAEVAEVRRMAAPDPGRSVDVVV